VAARTDSDSAHWHTRWNSDPGIGVEDSARRVGNSGFGFDSGMNRIARNSDSGCGRVVVGPGLAGGHASRVIYGFVC
jgi:hypothetical protein